VVVLLSQGNSCPQIALKMGIAINTVRRHVRDIAEQLKADPDMPALRRIRRNATTLLAA
jgi:DNA-binding NarL/FixJ family response regulator